MRTDHQPFPLKDTFNKAWQESLNRWTEEGLQCLWPHVHQTINWSQPVEKLNWTVSEEIEDAEKTDDANLLYKVSDLDGKDCLLWLHVVSKEERPEDLAARLFHLSHQLCANYQTPILPLVLVLQASMDWKAVPYQAHAFNYPTHRFEFQSVKISDWVEQEESLLSSENPFENIMGIYLTAKNTSEEPEARYQLKLKLHGNLLKKANTKEAFLDLYAFMDQCIPLSEAFHTKYHEAVYELERKKQLDYLISAENFGINHWIQKGFEEGVEKANRNHLQRMFSAGIDRDVIKNILRINDQELNRLLILENKETEAFETVLDE